MGVRMARCHWGERAVHLCGIEEQYPGKECWEEPCFFFFLWMISRAWEQAGLLYDDSSPCGCSKPKVLQEEVLVVFLWRPAGFSCRERGGGGNGLSELCYFLAVA